MSKLNVKQLDKQLSALSKSATLLRRRLNALYARYDHTDGDVTELEAEIGVLEARVKRIAALGQRFADDGFSLI